MKNASEKNGNMARNKFFMCLVIQKNLQIIDFYQMVHSYLLFGTLLLKTIFLKISFNLITTLFTNILRHYKIVYLTKIQSLPPKTFIATQV